jgi:hypothetical protein
VIYFVRRESDDAVKIGTTMRLSARLITLRTVHGSCELLAVMDGGHAEEQALHKRFRDQRVEKREWFRFDGPLEHFITTEARQWDGVDDKPLGAPIRIDREIYRKVKFIALCRHGTAEEVLNDLLGPWVDRQMKTEARKAIRRMRQKYGEESEATP